MNGFISFEEPLRYIVKAVIENDVLHAKWLNTLSFLENVGARKIAACEHPTLVKEEMLKHAAEEFRHAHYLKRQIKKVSQAHLDGYTPSELLGGMAAMRYLPQLDIQACRYLKGTFIGDIKEGAYLFVTYAIELRAAELYPIYDEALKKAGSRVHVRSILLEEKEHLREMQEAIAKWPHGDKQLQVVCAIEGELCRQWVAGVLPLLCLANSA